MLGILVLAVWRQPDVRVDVVDDRLVIVFRGLDVLLTMRRRVVVPLQHLEEIAAVPVQEVPRAGLRLPGIALPRLIRAGSFGRHPRRDLWDVRKGEQVLLLELRPGAPLRRIVLQIPEVAATALRLERSRRASHRGTGDTT